MPSLTIVYWRDIPAQVIAERGRGRRREQAKIELPDRFAKAIDAAAMKGGAADTDAYLEEWRKSDPTDCGEDLDAEARTVADQLDQEYNSEKLRALIASGGNAA